MIRIVGKQLHGIKKKSGKRVSLVGWSLGGLYSRQLAATYPDLVRQVITLGTPFGDPRSTIVWPIMQRLRDTPEPSEADMQRWMERARIPLEVPLSVIWSKTDGFVHPEHRLRNRRSPHREHPRLQQPCRLWRQPAGVLRTRRPSGAAGRPMVTVRASWLATSAVQRQAGAVLSQRIKAGRALLPHRISCIPVRIRASMSCPLHSPPTVD